MRTSRDERLDQPEAGATANTLPAVAVDSFAAAAQQQRLMQQLFGVAAEPSRIGRFVVLEELGRGGMGAVYSAYDADLDRKVALKFLHTERDLTPRFKREAQALARLSHPNVVQVYETGSASGRMFIAMEFVAGQTLREWLAGEERSTAAILGVFAQAGRGLAAAHDAGLVHRDFKPDNVMVTREGVAKVMDFGLASMDDSEDFDTITQSGRGESSGKFELTQSGTIMGTPAYMAPEQLLARPTDERSDQFAFCVALWEALFGQRPFEASTWDELRAVVSKGQITPPSRASEVPRWLRPILERGLATRPADRWSSMAELLDALAADPTHRRRRRWALGWSLAILAGAAIGGQAWQHRERSALQQACASEGRSIDADWSRAAREQMATAFEAAMPDTLGAETWARARAHVDAFSEDWARVRERACVETVLDEARTPESRARVDACLDEQRAVFRAVTNQWSEPRTQTVLGSVLAAAKLPRPADCLDERRLALQPELPAGPGERQDFIEVRAEIEYAAGLEMIEDRDEARVRIERAARTASERGWQSLRAEADFVAGSLRLDLQDFDVARSLLESAYLRATRSGNDRVALRAATGLIGATGDKLRQREEGERWAAIADALIGRLGLAGSTSEADLFHARGNLAKAHGEHEAALGFYRRSLEIFEASVGPDHPEVADTLNNLGLVQFELEAFDDALVTHQRALRIRELAFGPNHPQVAKSLALIGAVHTSARRLALALASYERAAAIVERALEPGHPRVIETLDRVGDIREVLGDFEGAVEIHSRVLAMLEAADEPVPARVARSLDNLADALSGLERHDEAIAAYRRAVDVLEASEAPDWMRVATLHVQIGDIEVERDHLDAALDAYQTALELLRRGGGEEHLRVASVLDDIGWIHAERSENERAWQAFERAVAIREAKLGRDHPDYGFGLSNLARVEHQRGAQRSALALYERSLAIQERALGSDNPSLSWSLLGMGEVLLVLGELERARASLERAQDLRRSGGASAHELADVRFALARVLARQGDRAQARHLAVLAQAGYREGSALARRELPAVEQWLAAHE